MSNKKGFESKELKERVGNHTQLVRVDSFIEDEGLARGTRRVRLVNGGGLEIEVHPDRCLDIGRVSFDGIPVAWISPVGPINPFFAEHSGNGWLRTFSGGLLATCGLDTFGPPSVDGSHEYGLHGRIGTLPATITSKSSSFDEVWISGDISQANVFGENLLLERNISSKAFSAAFTVKDKVTNLGSNPIAHLILYHLNFGWPLIDEKTILEIPALGRSVNNKKSDIQDFAKFTKPVKDAEEEVFLHHRDSNVVDSAIIRNVALGLELVVRVKSSTLPFIFQWKMLAHQNYVLGIEPTNFPIITGRADALNSGNIPLLNPGESVDYLLELEFRRFPGNSTL
jgi:hypothetical protein